MHCELYAGGFVVLTNVIEGLCSSPLISNPSHPLGLFHYLMSDPQRDRHSKAGVWWDGMLQDISSYLHAQNPDSRTKCHKGLSWPWSAAPRHRVVSKPVVAWSPPLPFLAAQDWERLPRAYANFPVIWSSPSYMPQDLRACVY